MSDSASAGGTGRRLVADTLHVASGRLAGMLVWLMYTPLVLDHLGPQRFALWALFYAVLGSMGAVDLGLVAGTVRHVAAARAAEKPHDAGAHVAMGLVGFMALGAVWFGAAAWLGETALDWLRVPETSRADAAFVLYAGAVVFALSGWANVIMGAAQGCGRFALANASALAIAFVQAVGIPLAIVAGGGLRWLLGVVALSWGAGFAFGALRLWPLEPGLRPAWPRDPRPVREAWAFGGPLQVTNALSALHTHLDKFLLARFAGLAVVAQFDLGMRIVVSVATFAQLPLAALLPVASRLHAAGDHAGLRALHKRATRWVAAGVVVLLAPIAGAADVLVAAWLGPGHDEAALALRCLAPAAACTLATGVASVTARATGRTGVEAAAAATLLAIHVALSVAFVPSHGLRGALGALLAANLLGGATLLVAVARSLGVSAREALVAPHAAPLAAGVAGAAAAWAVARAPGTSAGVLAWAALLGAGAAGALTSVGILLVLRHVRWSEACALVVAPVRRSRDGGV
uniref:Polysaccharide biosynthesis protein C-terminal domain-containing protein n=1 Tax=Eiseniibacteriota bacterium TaxID=2212470 RepID=A0A832I2H1_UNCEI